MGDTVLSCLLQCKALEAVDTGIILLTSQQQMRLERAYHVCNIAIASADKGLAHSTTGVFGTQHCCHHRVALGLSPALEGCTVTAGCTEALQQP